MNKKKVLITVAVISIIFVIIGIILVTSINKNANTILVSNMNVENVNNLDNNKDVEYNNQYDIGREYSVEAEDVIDNNVSKEETDYERYLRENDKNTYEEMSEFFENTTDKIVVYVNEEPITEREIALKNFSLNNEYIKNYTDLNLTEEDSDPVKAIIQDVVICQEAKKWDTQ